MPKKSQNNDLLRSRSAKTTQNGTHSFKIDFDHEDLKTNTKFYYLSRNEDGVVMFNNHHTIIETKHL